MELIFFFQAEDGIRDRSPSRGLGDVYKRQVRGDLPAADDDEAGGGGRRGGEALSLIHI